MLTVVVVLLAATAIAVPISPRLGLGSVLGYLVAGAVIGPHTLLLVTDVDEISAISELGIVMLLFLIGLELRPQRLWVMRRSVFGLGAGQVALSAAALAAMAWFAGVPDGGAEVLGLGFALSSTAIVLPLLAERKLLATLGGRDTFAVLLFQDLAFVPLVAVVPLLGGEALPNVVPWHEVGKAVLGIAVILAGGRLLLPLVCRAIGGDRTPEVFTAGALLIVAGTAEIATFAGLSPSLGAFMAGVLLSNSEFRTELQADIQPFEGLLLGFFFLSVGMGVDLGLMRTHPVPLVLGTLALLVVKTAIAYGLGRIAGQPKLQAVRFALALPQASEFSFVLFAAAVPFGALTPQQAGFATLVVAASMAATPVLFAASEAWLAPRLKPRKPEPAYEPIQGPPSPVIICGFGRVGQIVGRILRLSGIAYTALEKDAAQVETVRRFGTKVYFGDPTRAEVLRAAGADEAKLLIVVLEDTDETLRVAEIAKRTFPNLTVYARARNRRHAHMLMDRGVEGLVRETFFSSLKLAEMSLTALGMQAEDAARRIALFAEHDERHLIESHPIYRNEAKLIQNAKQQQAELATLFEADRALDSPPAEPEPTTRAAE